MANTDNSQSTKMITGKARLSYAHVWEATAIDDKSEKKYSCVLLINKNDKKTLDKIEACIKAAMEAGSAKLKGKNGKQLPNLKMPLRDGDIEKDDENYEGHYFLSCSSKTKPGIINLDKEEILDKDEVYSGCYAMVSINFYAFNTNGNAGIAVGLNNIMKVGDGEPLAGRASAADDFADVEYDGVDDLF